MTLPELLKLIPEIQELAKKEWGELPGHHWYTPRWKIRLFCLVTDEKPSDYLDEMEISGKKERLCLCNVCVKKTKRKD